MATVRTNMEYADVASEPKSGLCRLRPRCTSSKSRYLRMTSSNNPARTFQCCTPRTLLQRTHFHDSWRDFSVLPVVFVIILALLQGTAAQGFLASYSEYTSTFEWHNPDSLDPDGLNVCVGDRLSRAVDVLPRRKIIKNCETMDVFNPTACRAFRDGIISINDLYVRVYVVECCDGWLQSHTSCTQRCPPGTYGPACRLTCQCAGAVQLGCHHVTGECFCPTGRAGRVCQTTCAVAKNSYGPSCGMRCPYCRNGGVCDPISGECLCQRGYTGRSCAQREKCKGAECPFDCLLCNNEAACDQELGKCLCNPGWRGRYCTEPCPVGTFGSDCSQICTCLHNGECLPEDGSCVCPTGWIGAHCETACPESYWGDHCEMRCDCPDGRCDPFNGDCLCPKGRIGPRCIEECPIGFYGTRCSKICNCVKHYDCDPMTGRCYLVREILTTTAITTTEDNVTTRVPTTTTIPNTTPDDDHQQETTVSTFVPVTEPVTDPVTDKPPSEVQTQLIVGTSLGGVLVLAVLLTIAFIWIVFQRRDPTKSAKPINQKHQNKNNNSEIPVRSESTPTAAAADVSGTSQQDDSTKPKLPVRRLPQTPRILQKSMQIVSMKLSKQRVHRENYRSPVYESADKIISFEMETSASIRSYSDEKTSFNNPFYDGKRGKPNRRSVPDSVRRFTPTPFTRANTVHSSKNKVKSVFSSKIYEVPECEMELTPTSSRREQSVRAPSDMKCFGNAGYLELSGDLRDPANLYIGLLKNEADKHW